MDIFTWHHLIFATTGIASMLGVALMARKYVKHRFRLLSRFQQTIRVLFASILLAVILSVLWAISLISALLIDTISFSKDIDRRVRHVLYETDHAPIFESARDILQNEKAYPSGMSWHQNEMALFPKPITALNPSYVAIPDDRSCLSIEMGGGFFHYGFVIFSDPSRGEEGGLEVMPGMKFYTEPGYPISPLPERMEKNVEEPDRSAPLKKEAAADKNPETAR